jgi:hypothetical protein
VADRVAAFEQVRQRFRPEEVGVLFVGESPPAGGTFFYQANSNLYEATKAAFGAAGLPPGKNFLERFKALGCYLDDLCLEPVNHLKLDNPLARKKRLALRVQGRAPLADRMRKQPPRAIIVVMKGIEDDVRAAAVAAGLEDVPVHALPFPARREHRDRYVLDLEAILRSLKSTGVLRLSG